MINMQVVKQRLQEWERAQLFHDRLSRAIADIERGSKKTDTTWQWLNTLLNCAVSADSPEFERLLCSHTMAKQLVKDCMKRLAGKLEDAEHEFRESLKESETLEEAINTAKAEKTK